MFRRIEVLESLCHILGTFDVFEGNSCADPSHYTRCDVSFSWKVWNWLYYRLNVIICPVIYMYRI